MYVWELCKCSQFWGVWHPQIPGQDTKTPLCGGQMWCVTLPQSCSLVSVISGENDGGKCSRRALGHILRGEGQLGWSWVDHSSLCKIMASLPIWWLSLNFCLLFLKTNIFSSVFMGMGRGLQCLLCFLFKKDDWVILTGFLPFKGLGSRSGGEMVKGVFLEHGVELYPPWSIKTGRREQLTETNFWGAQYRTDINNKASLGLEGARKGKGEVETCGWVCLCAWGPSLAASQSLVN